MARSSTESGYSRGLNLIDATVERFKFGCSRNLKFHTLDSMKWNFLKKYIFCRNKNKSDFYFCHSYRMKMLQARVFSRNHFTVRVLFALITIKIFSVSNFILKKSDKWFENSIKFFEGISKWLKSASFLFSYMMGMDFCIGVETLDFKNRRY